MTNVSRTSTSAWRVSAVVVAAMCSMAEIPPISQAERTRLDRTLNAQGAYVSEESAYKFRFPRADLSVQVGGQRVTPAQAPASWVTFSPATRGEAIVNGELILLEDEVNPAISVALKWGLQVTGLGSALLKSQPVLLSLNINAEGTYRTLGSAVRSVLNEVQRVRATSPKPAAMRRAIPPPQNAIDAAPLNRILSMRGDVDGGIYRAAIGRVVLLSGTPLGREMGVGSRVTIFGTNERAFLEAEIMAGPDDLQRVLLAVRTRGLNIAAIRNHFTGAHPEAVFVRFSRTGSASELARAMRYVLDIQVGAVRPGP